MIGQARAILGSALGWGRQLRDASFRGERFYIENYGGSGGRRGPDHEYPDRNSPWAEDLGRRQRVWRFTGYVIGDDYPQRRDALIKACEADGPGKLIHPTIGEVEAVCRTFSYSEERERGRYCAFEFEFHEAGVLREPADETDTDVAVGNAAEPVGTSAIASFLGRFSTIGGGSWLNGAAAGQIQGFAATMQQLRLPAPTLPQSALGRTLDYLNRNAYALAGNAPDLANWMSQSFEQFTAAGEAQRVVPSMLYFLRPARGPGGLTQWSDRAGRALHGGVDLPITIRRANNQRAFDEFTYRLALREIGYAITGLELDNYQQARALLGELSEAFRIIEGQAADAGDDDVFIALVDLRAAITRMISAQAVGLNWLVTYRVTSPTPANSLSLAWRLYQSADRDLEICRRVSARNPAFLPNQGRVLAA